MNNIPSVALALCLSFAASAAPIFRNPLPVPYSNSGLWDLVEADFNGDGHTDLLTTDSSPEPRLTVYLANGSGPLATPVSTPVAGNRHPAIGDFDGDNIIDAVVPSFATQSLVFMHGNGDGTFTAGTSFAIGGNSDAILAGRFNGDAYLDLALTVWQPFSNNYAVAIYFGDGAGHFSAAYAPGIVESLPYIAPVDLNGDNKTDLIGAASILLGDGNGNFTSLAAVAAGDDAVIADFDHDGKLDRAGLTPGGLRVMRGNGNGTFGSPVSYVVEGSSIDGGDVDGDGHLDLITTYNGTVRVLRGKGDGTFHAAERWLSNPWAGLLAVDDFDRDGKLDVITAADIEAPALSFIRGKGDGSFETYRAFGDGPLARAPRALPADMNGDGKQDVVTMQEHSPHGEWDLAVLLNEGTGTLAPPILTATSAKEWSGTPNFVLGDLDGDGNIDAVVLDYYAYEPRAWSLRGNGDGTFAAPLPLNVGTGIAALGQFAGDANLDLYIGSNVSVDVYPGLGNGAFGTAVHSNIAGGSLFGDLNGDGKLDFVTRDIGLARAGINDGAGQFTTQLITNDEITARALGDFNGDGKLDVLFTTYVGTQTRLGNGDGTFGAPIATTIDPVPSYQRNDPITTGDFDGDGVLDVVVGTSVFLGNGDGRFRSRARFRTFELATAHVADMDGNGSPDLVTSNQVTNEIFVLTTRTTNDPTAQSSIALSCDKSSSTYGQLVTCTAIVTGGTVPFTGAVTFALNGVPAAIIAVTNGKALFKTAAIPAGAQTIAATYNGDEYYLPSTDFAAIEVAKATLKLTFSAFPNPAPQGEDVVIRAFLAPAPPFGVPGPGGTIAVRDGETLLGNVVPNSTINVSTLTVGSHLITGDYPGDANYEPATGSYTQKITKPLPSMQLQMTPASNILAGNPVTFRVDFPTSPNVTGTVAFYKDGTFHSFVTIVEGVASIETSFTWGQHSVTAFYHGDETWASASRDVYFEVLIGSWGTPMVLDAKGSYLGSALVRWSRVGGAVSYTLWRKTSSSGAWTVAGSYPASTSTVSVSMPENKTWLFAVTATDGSGNVSTMSAPDLATAILFNDVIQPMKTVSRAQHALELRSAIACVRTFAELGAYPYTNTPAAGIPIRAIDVQEMRIALSQAFSAIGLPAIAFTDPTITPSVTLIRAAHFNELRNVVQ